MFGIEHEQDEDDSRSLLAETPASSRKDRQQFINDYATRAIQNGMDPSQAWADANNMADRALALGHITGTEGEMRSAMDRKRAQEASGLVEMPVLTEIKGPTVPPVVTEIVINDRPPRANKDRQTFIDDYANRAIANGMEESRAWAEANNMADRALVFGHIVGDQYEMKAAKHRADAFRIPPLIVPGPRVDRMMDDYRSQQRRDLQRGQEHARTAVAPKTGVIEKMPDYREDYMRDQELMDAIPIPPPKVYSK